jgi:hypothetical protein
VTGAVTGREREISKLGVELPVKTFDFISSSFLRLNPDAIERKHTLPVSKYSGVLRSKYS